MPATDERALDALAIAIGEEWAASCAHALREQRRRVAGGWPGTMTEARARALATFARSFGGTPTAETLLAVSRAAYGVARTRWMAVAEPDVDELT